MASRSIMFRCLSNFLPDRSSRWNWQQQSVGSLPIPPPIPTSVPCSQAVMGRCLDSMPITCSDIANSSLATPPTAPDGLSILQSAGSGTDSLYYDNCASEPNILWPNFNSELVKIETSDRHPVCFHTSFVLLVETQSNALVCTF